MLAFMTDKDKDITAYCLSLELFSVSRPTQPPGSVNEDQLRLGRKRQVWFILLADVRGVCR